MDRKISNACARCGKERIETKSWTENLETFFGKSTIVHTETVCPDPECQKVVENGIRSQKLKTEQLQLARAERLKVSQDIKKKTLHK